MEESINMGKGKKREEILFRATRTESFFFPNSRTKQGSFTHV